MPYPLGYRASKRILGSDFFGGGTRTKTAHTKTGEFDMRYNYFSFLVNFLLVIIFCCFSTDIIFISDPSQLKRGPR